MDRLLDRIETTFARNRAAGWARYAALIQANVQDDAGDDRDAAAAELGQLMRDLGLTPDDVRRHVLAARDARTLTAEAATLDERKRAETAAREEKAALAERHKAIIDGLAEEERQAAHRHAERFVAVQRAIDAGERLTRQKENYAFLFRDAGGMPLPPPPPRLATDPGPQADPRVWTIPPDAVLTAGELRDDYGVAVKALADAGVVAMPGVPGGPPTYLGASVLAWAGRARAAARDRRRAELKAQIVHVPDELLAVRPENVYGPQALERLGAPVGRFRNRQEPIPVRAGGEVEGAHLIEWGYFARERTEAARAELAELDEQERQEQQQERQPPSPPAAAAVPPVPAAPVPAAAVAEPSPPPSPAQPSAAPVRRRR